MRHLLVAAFLLAACVHVYTERRVGEYVRPGSSPGTTVDDGEFSYFEDQLADDRHARTVSLMSEECAPYGQTDGSATILKEWTTPGSPPRHHVRYRCGVVDAGQ